MILNSSISSNKPQTAIIRNEILNTINNQKIKTDIELYDLQINDKELTDIIQYIADNFTNTKILNLSTNKITKIPNKETLATLKELKEIYFINNQITEIPIDIANYFEEKKILCNIDLNPITKHDSIEFNEYINYDRINIDIKKIITKNNTDITNLTYPSSLYLMKYLFPYTIDKEKKILIIDATKGGRFDEKNQLQKITEFSFTDIDNIKKYCNTYDIVNDIHFLLSKIDISDTMSNINKIKEGKLCKDIYIEYLANKNITHTNPKDILIIQNHFKDNPTSQYNFTIQEQKKDPQTINSKPTNANKINQSQPLVTRQPLDPVRTSNGNQNIDKLFTVKHKSNPDGSGQDNGYNREEPKNTNTELSSGSKLPAQNHTTEKQNKRIKRTETKPSLYYIEQSNNVPQNKKKVNKILAIFNKKNTKVGQSPASAQDEPSLKNLHMDQVVASKSKNNNTSPLGQQQSNDQSGTVNQPKDKTKWTSRSIWKNNNPITIIDY